jgi:hypothetical protein
MRRRSISHLAYATVSLLLAAAGIPHEPVRSQVLSQPAPGLMTTDPRLDEVRLEISNGTFVTRNSQLTPCFAGDAIASSEERKSLGETWAGRFTIDRAGTGEWQLQVSAPDTRQVWRAPLDLPAGTTIESGVLRSARVTVRLLGPGGAGQQCPQVRLVAELQEHTATKPRGLVGPDDRWAMSNANLHQQKDVARLLEWAEAVVHLQVVSRTGLLLPCSGFFVSPNVLMTAAHCIGSVEEAPKAIVHLPERLVTGPDLKLLMAQADLDFAVVRVASAQRRATLRLGGDVAGPSLVLWQFPSSNARLISVLHCSGARPPASMALTHKCDTSGGASGSPIQGRDSGQVVGLHTHGCVENGTNNCVNSGWSADEIRSRILQLENALRQWDAPAAEELIGALKGS